MTNDDELPLGPVTLAIDHVKAMRVCIAGPVNELGPIKQQLAHAGRVSVLTDPEHGLDQVRSALLPGKQLIVSVEDGDYATPELAPRMLAGWDAERIADAGASVVKCFFWYDTGEAGQQARTFLAEVASDCEAAGISLIAEPILVTPRGAVEPSEQHIERLLETVRELSQCGAAALKLEFPGGPDSSMARAVEVSGKISELSSVPWYLLSQGVAFDVFQLQLSAAVTGGASGCVVGRAVWRDLVTAKGVDNAAQQTLRDRLATLEQIVAEATGVTGTSSVQSNLPGGQV